ncbi:preprotein translocase subunit SecG [Altericroceibacterium endophyticum]|uniref:Protein-export membrane protein SecG n=1 Tax=Altericroceibacterium endophyticum TaxID=1808508 RepID=A0A6I4T6Y6_9SPHN|nr:preprotein translocase subunit SecG [Altericroceibacterium endophyticum]MXO65972.1 preprotein translocase subunit SecG [Altericroceibacterium endophyticum]
MSLFLFLTVVQAIIAAALVGVILMQRSEGGGLGVGGGGSPGGLMSARGAADFLTRTTRVLAILFVVLAIVLAAVAVDTTGTRNLDDSLDRSVLPKAQQDELVPGDEGLDGEAPVSSVPTPESDDPLSGVAQ